VLSGSKDVAASVFCKIKNKEQRKTLGKTMVLQLSCKPIVEMDFEKIILGFGITSSTAANKDGLNSKATIECVI
jgi:hypothetical protein